MPYTNELSLLFSRFIISMKVVMVPTPRAPPEQMRGSQMQCDFLTALSLRGTKTYCLKNLTCFLKNKHDTFWMVII